jgi:hypothetical protein
VTEPQPYAETLPGNLQRAIEPGETLVWVGKPDVSLFYLAYTKRNMIAAISMLILSVVWCLSFGMSMASLWLVVIHKPVLLLALLASIAIVLVGYLLFPKLLSEQRYVLTDRHLYVRHQAKIAKVPVTDVTAVTRTNAGINIFAKTASGGMRPFATLQCLADSDRAVAALAATCKGPA